MTARLDRLSDSQSNAEAISRRDSAYLSEHYGSRGQRDFRGRPLPRPRGLIAMLRWFEAEWHDQAPDAIHKREVWHEYVHANELWLRHGGGSVLGAHAWTDPARRLFQSPWSVDADEHFHHPLAAALASIERRDAFMAAFLRAIALAGFQISPVGLRLGYEESVVMVYADAALERLWGVYRVETPPRPLTSDVSSAQPKPAVVTGMSTTPDLLASPSPSHSPFPPDPTILRRIA